MAYIVTDSCIKCKYTDCVDVCPVSCFHEGDMMLVIDPQVCIDCGVCEPECPVGAIKPESPKSIHWVEMNAKLSREWPKILKSKSPLPEAEKYAKETNKFEKYCSTPSIAPKQN
jgi:ferredoxin